MPEIDRQQAVGTRVAFRADAAFAKPEIYDALEQRDVDYAIRLLGWRSRTFCFVRRDGRAAR